MYSRHGRAQKIKNFGGEQIVLGLRLKKKMPYKKYNLYTIYKLIDGEEVPLYDETFTDEQVSDFYTKSSYYVPK